MTYYVAMTDKFMSGWGPAERKINRLVVECETAPQAQAIEQAARQRSEMIRITISENKPKSRPGVLYSWRKFADMGGPWLAHYEKELA